VGAVAAADPSGRPNPLLAAYRADALREAVTGVGATGRTGGAGRGAGVAAARLLPDDVVVVDLGPEATLNVNRPEDLERAVAAVEGVRDPPRGAC
jgi:molybdopterin-guanine dinucleotide biosynthesis protein A